MSKLDNYSEYSRKMRVALVYDRVNKWGGAERVLLALNQLFPEAPLFTSVYDKKKAPWADVFTIKTSFLQQFPFAPLKHEAFALLMPLAFESFNFDEYDVVISVTSEAAKGILTKPGTRHICYCLTPTRYLWSAYDEYFENRIFRTLGKPAVWYLRKWDKIASLRPDTMIAISHEVRKRIKTFYNRDSRVIYPPLTFMGKDTVIRSGSYYLVVSRLVAYKRIDLAIKAANQLEIPLVIVGTGDEEKRLRGIAGKTVDFVGQVTDDELAEYYAGSKALLFPGLEDFGLSVVEAQRYGKPVIAYKDGGQLETIIDGKTGIFFTPQTADALIGAIERFEKKSFDPKKAQIQAEKFSMSTFEKNLMNIIKNP